MTIDKQGSWRLYWGSAPLPIGSEAVGVVARDSGVGALIRMSTGVYVQGNAGCLRSLPQRVVRQCVRGTEFVTLNS